ncbi:MAG TPA: acyl-CoA dehydrogenase, partial [Solimonas sp.]|nr:acyl-CoA dehydrogenase [Solimonas sp.]
IVSIGGGADEVMLGIICKMMGTLPGKRKFEQARAAQAARHA